MTAPPGPETILAPLRAALAGRYRLAAGEESLLGEGGMACVFRAHDLRHDRPVAIKVLRPEVGAELGAERFLQEIHLAAQLQHPLILPLFDSGDIPAPDPAGPPYLYYVMPLVEGETLRARLDRERQLPVPDALAIARDVAEALAHAHGQGVVHRDVKPENIFLTAGHALVADFGIARAITAAGGRRITSQGVALGTPHYMSPEQAGGDDHLDGRSDLYSLGCVLYEMLAGQPPFTGRTAQAVIARHLHERPPSLRVVRPTLPPGVEQAIETALAKVPADRFTSVMRFAEALAADRASRPGPRRPAGHLLAMAGGLVLLGGLALGIRALTGDGRRGGRPGPDTTRYLVFPFTAPAPREVDGAQLIQDALARWTGITAADPFRLREEVAALGGEPLASEAAGRLARRLDAGRYLRGDLSRSGDSLRLHAVLYHAGPTGDSVLAEGAIRIPEDPVAAASGVAGLVDSLLLRGSARHARLLDDGTGTRSLPARQALRMGEAAVEQWELSVADTHFSTAARLDPQYALAHLWLALVRTWSGQPSATWASSAERASAGRGGLSARARGMGDAVRADSRGDVARACAGWADLAGRTPEDFLAWYGWGDCLRRDNVVVPDPSSPTRWRFRSSYHQAVQAYRRAFQLLPSIHRGFRDGSFRNLRDLLMTSGDDLRRGRGLPPDTTTYYARPALESDTLVLLPMPAREVARGRSTTRATSGEAVLAQRRLFYEIASAWAVAQPPSADAMEALAVSLELLGNRRALDTLRRARNLARSPAERFRIAAGEAWIQLKYALPGDEEGLRAVFRLGDSLLRAETGADSTGAGARVNLAILLGRIDDAARWSRGAGGIGDWAIPPPLAHLVPPLVVYAAAGGPAESLAVFAREVAGAIEREVAPEERTSARLQFLAYPATVVFPEHPAAPLIALAGGGDVLLDAQVAGHRGDRAAAWAYLARLREQRASVDPATLTLDALYPEAALLAALGDTAAAAGWLDPTLAALPAAPPELLSGPLRAGALIRAMALRAELGTQLGEGEAALRWARAVTILWARPDRQLQPLVDRLTHLRSSTREAP